MIYECEFPFCNYRTKNRHQIEYHHIVPKELNGSDKKQNRIYLCPNHHRCVFIEESNIGLHSIRAINSIVIKGFLNSTAGKILHYIDCETGKECFYCYRDKYLSTVGN